MPDVLVDRQGAVTILTLNRPEAHNAVSPDMITLLKEQMTAFDADETQKVMIITGAGEKAFSSGADLTKSGTNFMPVSDSPDVGGVTYARKPVIAAVNGLAIGAGMELSMCCDIRIAAEGAWFALPEAGHGFIPSLAAILLPRMMPFGVAMDMMLAGERLTADDALRLGFVQKLVPADQLLTAALAKAERMTRYSQPALWGVKQAGRFWLDIMLSEHQRYYEAVVHRVLLAGDVHEGLAAFRNKRKPEFTQMRWPNPFDAG